MKASLLFFLSAAAALCDCSSAPVGAQYDLVIYGATPAGIAAAVQAKRMGLRAVLIEPTRRIGGLTTGGLGQTDIGHKEAFGGIAREFYRDVRTWYSDPKHWTRQTFADYSPDGQCSGTKLSDTMWTFEPSAALAILEGWERRDGLDIRRGERLDRQSKFGVEVEDRRIKSIRTLSGNEYRGRMFLDCTYEGDLMAAAGVSYAVGREANEVYGETINGIERRLSVNHQMQGRVDAYVRKGDPSSGLLPGVEPEDPRPDGAGDDRVQAYCFRMCLTDDPGNRIPFAKPDGYRELDYEVLLRNLEAGPLDRDGLPWINSKMPNRKTDTNNRTGFSTDLIGGSSAYPEASYAERERIAAAHLRYQRGLMWTLANHPRVPERIRREVSRWGTCRDEFVGERGDGWQNQLYVREARRMVGAYVMTEHECLGERTAPSAVALGAYGMDSHNCRRYADGEGHVRNEGNIEHWTLRDGRRIRPYPIGYGALVPKRGECANLLVPVCLSASHMAFGSIRMEPVFFALGQAAATAAAQAIAANCAVQDVPYAPLRARLLADGQVLDPPFDEAKARPYSAVGPKRPEVWERTALGELTNYLNRVASGGRIAVDGNDAVTFHVGDTDFAKGKGLGSSAFKDEEWCVKSFGRDVVLNGGGTRGALYAVYHFLEDNCGVHWWNEGDEDVPEAKPLAFPALDRRGRPHFRRRDIYRKFGEGTDPLTSARLRLNANGPSRMPLKYGGGVEFGPPCLTHAWDRYLPFEKYGKEHPEWYSYRKKEGKRIGGIYTGQLCLSNPELVPLLVRLVKESIAKGNAEAHERGFAEPVIYALNMNDNRNYCECEACLAEIGKYGLSGQQLRFINAIATEVGKEHPDLRFRFSAYLYAEDPPKGGVKAADNVLVGIALTTSNLAGPIDDAKNEYIREMPLRWKDAATGLLMVADYGVTYWPTTFGWPFPSEFHIADKVRYYADCGATYYFLENEMVDASGRERIEMDDMYELKLYLARSLLEDPKADADVLVAEFMRRYYGAAGADVRAARVLLEENRRAATGSVSWFPRRFEFNWITDETIAGMLARFDAAERAVAGDARLLKRVRAARKSADRIAGCRRTFRGFAGRIPASAFSPQDKKAMELVDDASACGGKALRIKADASKYSREDVMKCGYSRPGGRGVLKAETDEAEDEWRWYRSESMKASNGYLYICNWLLQVEPGLPEVPRGRVSIRARLKLSGPKFFPGSSRKDEVLVDGLELVEDADR